MPFFFILSLAVWTFDFQSYSHFSILSKFNLLCFSILFETPPDILVIPGGTVNADTLRINPDAQKIIQHFTDHQKPIAAICHAPWTLINAERIRDKNLTSYKSIKLDLENAGATWVDEQVHRCNTGGWVLITSRDPNDIPAFNQAILEELETQKDLYENAYIESIYQRLGMNSLFSYS